MCPSGTSPCWPGACGHHEQPADLPASLCPENKFVTCQVQHLSKASKTVDVPCKCKGQRAGWVRPHPSTPTQCGPFSCGRSTQTGLSPSGGAMRGLGWCWRPGEAGRGLTDLTCLSSGCPEECLPLNCEPSLSLQPPALEDLLLSPTPASRAHCVSLRKAEGASFTWSPTGGKTAVQGLPSAILRLLQRVQRPAGLCVDPEQLTDFSCSGHLPRRLTDHHHQERPRWPGPPRGRPRHSTHKTRSPQPRPPSSPAHPSQRETEAISPGLRGTLPRCTTLTPDPLSALQ